MNSTTVLFKLFINNIDSYEKPPLLLLLLLLLKRRTHVAIDWRKLQMMLFDETNETTEIQCDHR